MFYVYQTLCPSLLECSNKKIPNLHKLNCARLQITNSKLKLKQLIFNMPISIIFCRYTTIRHLKQLKFVFFFVVFRHFCVYYNNPHRSVLFFQKRAELSTAVELEKRIYCDRKREREKDRDTRTQSRIPK